jgi:hypothetical protein
MKYTVDILQVINRTVTLSVEADNEGEAEQLAFKKLDSQEDFENEEYEVIDTEIERVNLV